MYVPNLKSVPLPVPEIIGGIPQKLGSLWIRRLSLFSKIFHGCLFGWTMQMYLPNLKSVALPVPEIIGVPPKIGESVVLSVVLSVTEIIGGTPQN